MSSTTKTNSFQLLKEKKITNYKLLVCVFLFGDVFFSSLFSYTNKRLRHFNCIRNVSSFHSSPDLCCRGRITKTDFATNLQIRIENIYQTLYEFDDNGHRKIDTKHFFSPKNARHYKAKPFQNKSTG